MDREKPFSALYIPRVYMRSFYDHTFCMETYHSHNSLELMYLMSGEMTVEQLNEEDVPFAAGQFVLVRCNHPHRLRALSDNIELLVLEIAAINNAPIDTWMTSVGEFSAYPSIVKLMEGKPLIRCFSDSQDVGQTLSHLLDLLRDHHNDVKNEFFELDYEISLKRLLLSICRCRTAFVGVSSNRYVNRAVNFIRDNYSRNISASDIAAFIGITPSYAQKIFFDVFGMTIMKTVDYYRMRQAEFLLASTDFSLVEIAKKAGFVRANTLYKHFRAEHGCSPSDYRRQLKNQPFYVFDPNELINIKKIAPPPVRLNA